MPRELTKMQKDFCEFYLKTGSVREAAKEAKYKDSTIRSKSYKWLKNPRIIEYFSYLEQLKFNNYLEQIEKLIELAIEEKNLTALTKALDMKGKTGGFFNIKRKESKEVKVEEKPKPPEKDFFERVRERADELRREKSHI